MPLMFILHDDEVYIDNQVDDLEFFKYCYKLDSFIFPNFKKLDPIDVVTFIIDNPSEARFFKTDEVIKLDSNNVFDTVKSELVNFKRLCFLARDLRKKGWFLRRGFNYGADFLLYDQDPGLVHSKFAVYFLNRDECKNWSRILGMNRVCVNSKKVMLLAVPSMEEDNSFKFIQIKRWLPESNRK